MNSTSLFLGQSVNRITVKAVTVDIYSQRGTPADSKEEG